jgi:hypothetical protein
MTGKNGAGDLADAECTSTMDSASRTGLSLKVDRIASPCKVHMTTKVFGRFPNWF